MTSKLKYSGFKLGQKIRAFDFQPMEGREDRFVEGVIVDVQYSPYHSYQIEALEASSDHYSEGDRVSVPMEMSFMEYDGRVVAV